MKDESDLHRRRKNEKYYLYYWSHSSHRSGIIVDRFNIIDKNDICEYKMRTTHKFSIMSFYYAWSLICSIFDFKFKFLLAGLFTVRVGAFHKSDVIFVVD